MHQQKNMMNPLSPSKYTTAVTPHWCTVHINGIIHHFMNLNRNPMRLLTLSILYVFTLDLHGSSWSLILFFETWNWTLHCQLVCLSFAAHTPDNSFMGFVAEELNETVRLNIQRNKVNNMAVVYGKEASMWKVSIAQQWVLCHSSEVTRTAANVAYFCCRDFFFI